MLLLVWVAFYFLECQLKTYFSIYFLPTFQYIAVFLIIDKTQIHISNPIVLAVQLQLLCLCGSPSPDRFKHVENYKFQNIFLCHTPKPPKCVLVKRRSMECITIVLLIAPTPPLVYLLLHFLFINSFVNNYRYLYISTVIVYFVKILFKCFQFGCLYLELLMSA